MLVVLTFHIDFKPNSWKGLYGSCVWWEANLVPIRRKLLKHRDAPLKQPWLLSWAFVKPCARGRSSEQLSSLASTERGLMESFMVTTVEEWQRERKSHPPRRLLPFLTWLLNLPHQVEMAGFHIQYVKTEILHSIKL